MASASPFQTDQLGQSFNAMPATINGTTGFGGNLTGNVTGNVTGTASAIADGAVSAAKLDGAQSGSAPIYGCRAWVNFDGTRDTTGAASTANTNRLIRASGNVASVLRNSAGDYTITFTTAISDTNYCVTTMCGADSLGSGSGYSQASAGNLTTTSVKIFTRSVVPSVIDAPNISVAIFR